ncbi:MAG TPA: hypothetical protein VMX17_06580 [Candidatus Glassbacteria bacterium]|nr:hypothetical protein [Candidatus Glassbacteria bacterium]
MGLIFKDDPKKDAEKAAKKAAKESKSNVAPQPTITPVTQQSVASMPSIAGVVDDKFMEMLWSVISQNNIPGQDYFEFKQAIDAMASLPIDERSKFLTTFTIFNSQGCKKDTLVSSIDRYVNVIQSELSSFNAEFANQRQEKVTTKLQQVEEAKKKVEELNKKIVEVNNFILTATQEAQQEELQLQMTAGNFEKSAEKVIAVLEGDKNKINNYIQ